MIKIGQFIELFQLGVNNSRWFLMCLTTLCEFDSLS